MKIKDKTVVQNLGFCAFGGASNFAHVDVLDGRIARIRPLHYDDHYTPEDLNAWEFNVRGSTFKPGFKSLIPPLSLAYKRRAYSPNRVPYPLKRVDWDPNGERNTQNRGISGYERISWDEAAAIIAAELVRIHDTYGNRAILVQGEGHGETKIISGPHGCQSRLLDLIGPETDEYTVQARQPDSWEGWYWGAKHVWGSESHGQQNPQTNVVWDIAKNSDALLFWGADPETTPMGWGGFQPSRICFWLTEIGVRQIHIAPDVNYTNAVHADRWIPVLPNTDAAFQLAIAYVWMTEDLYDKDYVATHVEGFDWFEYYVLGHEDGVPKTPEWAAEKCGIPSYRIKAFARYWGTHLVSISHCNGGGYIRSCYSHEPARLEAYLLGMQGLGKPGVSQLKWIEWGIQGIYPVPTSEINPIFYASYKGWMMHPGKYFIPKTMTPQAILGIDNDESISWYGHVICSMNKEDQFLGFEYPGDGPRLHMIWSDTPCWETCWNGGTIYQDAVRHPSIEFYVVQHQWMENDTLMADIILPICTIFELQDIAADPYNGQWIMVAYEEQAIEPVGEAKGDFAAVCEVARALEKYGGIYEGLYEKYTRGLTFDDDVRIAYEHAEIPLDEYPLEKFIDQKYLLFPTPENWEDLTVGFNDFYRDPEANPLKTPTGKLEFYSTNLAHYFPDDKIRGPVAHWIEEGDGHQERISSDRAQDYPYLLVSNHPRWRVHAQHDDIQWLREIKTCKVRGADGYQYEPIWIHPDDAALHGLEDGDVAELFNERGRVLGGIIVTERIMPGVLYQDHGARTDILEFGVGGLDRGGANNLICPTKTSSKNAAGEVTNGFLVGIRKADLKELAARYPEAWNRDYDPHAGLVARARIVDNTRKEA
ncbi:MAG: molybdopterin-dependent oxidoreductase [Coriobacteriales bacterium]|jgi:trimethylamine-N-oxide reductase (cytochrome c)|nr:molybdopterin-dependent oxidoreductase [Coriobacteriales bacterium]